MKELINYSIQYPDIPIEIVLFFSGYETKEDKLVKKRVFEFCEFYKKKYNTELLPQPKIVSRICDILCENGALSLIEKGGMDNMGNSYIAFIENARILEEPLKYYYSKRLSYLTYGFKYIYEDYKKYILPIEYTDEAGNKSLGTSFLYKHGIVTAKHCIEGAKQISIQGILKEDLIESKFEIHENNLMDLLYIRFAKERSPTIVFEEQVEILEDVMTLGYPKISGYHNFLTAENATVAARFTASTGQVVSNAEDIWIKERLFLISAKIKGGNSGGPVVKKNGSVVGVSVNMTTGDGDYDNLGYGTVIPIHFVDAIINSELKIYLNTGKIEFVDFMEDV